MARIELRFRSFINRALVERFWLGWWEKLAPANLRSKVASTRDKDKENDAITDPLEYTQFDDLVELITAEVSKWSTDRALSVSDFSELLHCATSIGEVKTRLDVKTTKISYWDRVFAKYFQDRKQI